MTKVERELRSKAASGDGQPKDERREKSIDCR